MANRLGISMGEVFRDAQAGYDLKQRKEARKVNPVMQELRGKAATGDIDAGRQLLALDPAGAPAFLSAVSAMDKKQLDMAKANTDQIGKMSAFVLQGATPEDQEQRYQTVRANLPKDVASTLPEEYNPQFVELSLAKAMAMDKILENPKSISVGDQDVVYKGGKEIERRKKPVKSGADQGLKSADESLMFRQSAELLGGIFDEAGNLTNLDPQTRNRIQGIATRATEIFKERGNITRSQAVTAAAKEAGLSVGGKKADKPEEKTDKKNSDPDNIRQFLMGG